MSQSTLATKQASLTAKIAKCDKALADLYFRYFGEGRSPQTSVEWDRHDAEEYRIELEKWQLNNKLAASKCTQG